MTLLGKILVFFNLAFALLLAGWSFSLYANGLDWTDRKEGNVAVGEFAKREPQLEELWKSVPPAQVDWRKSLAALKDAEKRLVDARVWYDAEMRHVFVGPTKGRPVGQLVLAAKNDPKTGLRQGQIVLDAQGNPQLTPLKDRAGQPLASLAEYNKRDETILVALEEVMRKHEKQIAEANKYTDTIIGSPDKRGFQRRIEDERAKGASVLAEQKSVRQMLINTVVASEGVFKRKAQLEKRVEELKKFKVARGGGAR